MKQFSSDLSSKMEGLEVLNRERFDRFTSTIGVHQLENKRGFEDVRAQMGNLATLQQVQKLNTQVNACAKLQQIKDMENRVTPMLNQANSHLEIYRDENAQMKQMIIRFDEVISDKINKIALETYAKEAKSFYLSIVEFSV